jgi:hypothetical protein
MADAWPVDPRLVRASRRASGRDAIPRDAIALLLAGEVKNLIDGLPQEDPAAGFVVAELEAALDALRFGITNAFIEERFAALTFCRVLVESAIRLVWLVSHGSDERRVRISMGRLEKRDIQQLLAASRSINESSSFGHIVQSPESIVRYLDSLDHPAAPEVRQMADQAGWEWLYGIHRFCSTMLHPGLGVRSRISEIVPPETYAVLLYLAFSLSADSGGQVGRALFPQVGIQLPRNALVLERRGIVELDDLVP